MLTRRDRASRRPSPVNTAAKATQSRWYTDLPGCVPCGSHLQDSAPMPFGSPGVDPTIYNIVRFSKTAANLLAAAQAHIPEQFVQAGPCVPASVGQQRQKSVAISR